jgi:DNA-binding Lrp family transcriptional regulator
MVESFVPRWGFLTNHAQVLVCIADEPGVRLRDISERVGITERAAHRIVAELAEAGYITRKRAGRRNAYLIHTDLPLPDALARNHRLGDLLAILVRPSEPMPSPLPSAAD